MKQFKEYVMKVCAAGAAWCLLMCGALAAGGCQSRVYEVVGTAQEGSTAAGSGLAAFETGGTAASGPADTGTGGAVTSVPAVAGTGSAAGNVLIVYVCGAVKNPGVYELQGGARVYQLIEAAGGLLPEADGKALNQARVLADGEQVVVLTVEETAGLASGNLTAGAAAGSASGGFDAGAAPGGISDGKININTADASELMTLKGIGAARAADIIAYREKNGGFQTIEEIMKVSGIKNSLFEGIRDGITVG